MKDLLFILKAKVVGDHVLDVDHEVLENNDIRSVGFRLGELQVDANGVKVGQQKQGFVFLDEGGKSN